jgi:hypothetical protein
MGFEGRRDCGLEFQYSLRGIQDLSPSGTLLDLGFKASAGQAVLHHYLVELRAELEAAGFQVAQLLGVEEIGWTVQEFGAALDDPLRREWIPWVARRIEAEPTLVGPAPM